MAAWSELPDHIVGLFLKRISPYVEEFARFSSVCKPWKSVAVREKEQFIRCAPWLMLINSDNDDGCIIDDNKKVPIRSFFSLTSQRLFNLQLPQAQGRRCWGTPYGWLITLGVDLNIHLLNPLSKIQLSLPPQPTFPDQHCIYVEPEEQCRCFVRKFAVSSNPSLFTTTTTTTTTNQGSLVVMAIYGGCSQLAIAAPGDEAWISLESPPEAFDDIIFFKEHFYAITTLGTLRICDIETTPPKTTVIASPPDDIDGAATFYLVELSGELYFVARAFSAEDEDVPTPEYHLSTDYFEVFRFDFHTNKWTQVEDLGHHALFLGNNTSFAISTVDFPEYKRNCIYFTDDHLHWYQNPFCDMGVYDMEEETIEPIYSCGHHLSKFSRPLFFMPTTL